MKFNNITINIEVSELLKIGLAVYLYIKGRNSQHLTDLLGTLSQRLADPSNTPADTEQEEDPSSV